MQIVLKPLGAVAVSGAIGLLALLAFQKGSPKPQESVSGQAQPSATTGETTSGSPLVVFKDGLENGWEERGFAKVVDYKNASPVHGSAGTSIRVEAGPWEAVKIYHPTTVDLSPCKYLVCFVNGGEKGGQPLVVNAIAQGKNQGSVSFPPLPPNKYFFGIGRLQLRVG